MAIDRGKDKEMWYTYTQGNITQPGKRNKREVHVHNGILLNHEKEQITCIHDGILLGHEKEQTWITCTRYGILLSHEKEQM